MASHLRNDAERRPPEANNILPLLSLPYERAAASKLLYISHESKPVEVGALITTCSGNSHRTPTHCLRRRQPSRAQLRATWADVLKYKSLSSSQNRRVGTG